MRNIFKTFLAPHMNSFLDEKRALGYSYRTDEKLLVCLDKFIYSQHPEATYLSHELITAWLDRYEIQDSTKSRNLTVINELARFMIRHGVAADVIPFRKYPKYTRTFRARILTVDEINRLLAAADSYPETNLYPNLHYEISCLFHLLINAGFRISELFNMKICDVDMENAILTVKNGKNQIARHVPLSREMANRLSRYIEKVYPSEATPDKQLFPGTRSAELRNSTIHRYFRNLLRMANIPYCGKRQGPRIHDLRHTFAVHCLNRWVRQQVDIDAALPILSKFLGHVGIRGTQNYLQFTAEMYPDFIEKMDASFGSVVSKGNIDNENN